MAICSRRSNGTAACGSEADNGLGDGDTANDVQIQGTTVLLRAERSGHGAGRTYTVTVRCVDSSGNASTTTTSVTVPKSQAS